MAGEAELTSADATTLHAVPPHLREGQSERTLTGLLLKLMGKQGFDFSVGGFTLNATRRGLGE